MDGEEGNGRGEDPERFTNEWQETPWRSSGSPVPASSYSPQNNKHGSAHKMHGRDEITLQLAHPLVAWRKAASVRESRMAVIAVQTLCNFSGSSERYVKNLVR
ncbi:unnamed protein product [Arctogadus glacialis]